MLMVAPSPLVTFDRVQTEQAADSFPRLPGRSAMGFAGLLQRIIIRVTGIGAVVLADQVAVLFGGERAPALRIVGAVGLLQQFAEVVDELARLAGRFLADAQPVGAVAQRGRPRRRLGRHQAAVLFPGVVARFGRRVLLDPVARFVIVVRSQPGGALLGQH